ncbi:MAG: DNA-3-methyladenine glycosylase [Patescibacteria group bacterium]|nr:DNA-3-methyladenine glycosylase [Patescibacteria group bacterium]
MKITRNFFNRDTSIVAQELLGKVLVVVNNRGEVKKVMITETEAYHGFDDKASHASRTKTERNKIMFDKAGLVYVYLIYGMHWCLNFTTMPEGFPAAVLIRSIAIPVGARRAVPLQIRGPGRITKCLGIDKTFYGEDLTKSKRIWIEPVETHGRVSKKCDIISSKRIGVDYADECKEWEWNYKINL